MMKGKWFSKEIDTETFYTAIEDPFRQVGPPTETCTPRLQTKKQ